MNFPRELWALDDDKCIVETERPAEWFPVKEATLR